jgi:hypothetical protein
VRAYDITIKNKKKHAKHSIQKSIKISFINENKGPLKTVAKQLSGKLTYWFAVTQNDRLAGQKVDTLWLRVFVASSFQISILNRCGYLYKHQLVKVLKVGKKRKHFD